MVAANWQIQFHPTLTEINKRREEIMSHLLIARGLNTKKQRDAFIHPKNPLDLHLKDVNLYETKVGQAVAYINQAVKTKTPILIFGDYDADGVTATAILWEALHSIGAKAYPFIPNRELHGYGLSIKGLTDAFARYHQNLNHQKPLIITVDNGITAHESAAYIKNQGLDLIITDHHQVGPDKPPASVIVHTTDISGAGIAWMLAKELSSNAARQSLDLVAIGTIADLMPLFGPNRSLAKFGLEALGQTRRPGLLALMKEAGIQPQNLSTYHVSFVIAPRINAMGRLKDALESLRLLLTGNAKRAEALAQTLSSTNRERQDLTQTFLEQAKVLVESNQEHILIIDHQDFHEGVIGLVAGKLVEKYYRPAIVISRGSEVSKASARSIPGVNIVETIRKFSSYLTSAGGHPMAAGFSLETKNIDAFRQALEAHAKTSIDASLLTPTIKIDSELILSDVTDDLVKDIDLLKPFGLGNSKPLFCSNALTPVDIRTVGNDNRHLKLIVKDDQDISLPAIGFGLGDRIADVMNAQTINLAYTIEENVWNHHRTLQLQVKDLNTDTN